MTEATEPRVPAGWYPDPWGSSRERWWDGSAWTETLSEETPNDPEVSPQAAETYEPQVTRSTYESASASTGLPSRRALREHADTTHESEPELVASAQSTASALLASPLPPLTQAPQFTPEPVASALPAPVFTDPEPEPEPEPVPEPAASVPATAVPLPATSDIFAVSAPATDDSDDGWAASLRGWDSIEATTPPPDAPPIFGDVPPVSYSHRPTVYTPTHGRTSPVWAIVVMPIIHAAAVIGSLFLVPGLIQFDGTVASVIPNPANLAALQDWLIFASAPLSIAFFLFTLIMGFQDRARLRLLGHEETASPWWIVLSPLVYLIVRSVRVRQATGKRGSGPLTTYLCLYVAPPLALVVTTAVVSALDGALPS